MSSELNDDFLGEKIPMIYFFQTSRTSECEFLKEKYSTPRGKWEKDGETV